MKGRIKVLSNRLLLNNPGKEKGIKRSPPSDHDSSSKLLSQIFSPSENEILIDYSGEKGRWWISLRRRLLSWNEIRFRSRKDALEGSDSDFFIVLSFMRQTINQEVPFLSPYEIKVPRATYF